MKERPILFNGSMVRAILDGRKTQTRRIVKNICDPILIDDILPADPKGFWCFHGNDPSVCIDCPYGEVGDRLWVRETWAPVSTFDPSPETGALYRADPMYDGANVEWSWKPSIHMPRWASRITLEVTGVRVERLQEITNDDCVAEGITAIGKGVRLSNGSYAQAGRYENKASTVRQLFSELWESINGPGSWSLNPWVWVIEFKRVTP